MNWEINETKRERFKPVTICITCETRAELNVLYQKIGRTAGSLEYDWSLWSKLTEDIAKELG